MSDAGLPVQDPIEPITTDAPASQEAQAPAQRKAPRKRSMMADPVVRVMMLVAFGIVILALLMVMGVLLSGVANSTGPRTMTENELMVSGEAVRAGKTDAATWGKYIAALVANKRYTQAENLIADAKGSIEDSKTAELSVAEARLLLAREDYKQLIVVADKGQKQIEASQKAALDAGGQTALTAKLDGLHENWFVLALLKSDAYRSQGDWAKVITELDSYLAENPQAADILIERGNAKIEAKDNAGAEADFNAALRFVPNDKDALAGLAKIGAATK